MGIFKSAKHVAIGKKKFVEGRSFELIFDKICSRFSIFSLEIPMGCKRTRFKIYPVKSPFDRVIASTDGKCAFLDLKSVGKGYKFSKSMVNESQVRNLIMFEKRHQSAGYVVFFREINSIVFFRAGQLYDVLITSKSLSSEDGVNIGSLENMEPLKIFRKEAYGI